MDRKLINDDEKERGEVMLEGMIVVIMTTFMLLWILAIGFVYYQKYLVTIVTNDTAEKIAATYTNPTSDIVMGYVSSEMLLERDLYRGIINGTLEEVNKERAENYIKYMLANTNAIGVIKNPEEDIIVELQKINDSAMRSHIEITTTCTFHTPLGEVIAFLGGNESITYSASARADCTDLIEFFATSDFQKMWIGVADEEAIAKAIGSVGNMIQSIIGYFNQVSGD